MATTPPTYGASYNQTEQNTNAATICTALDAGVSSDANKAAMLAWVTQIQAAVLLCMASHTDGTGIGRLQVAFTNVEASLT
jgi:hypothetical protein